MGIYLAGAIAIMYQISVVFHLVVILGGAIPVAYSGAIHMQLQFIILSQKLDQQPGLDTPLIQAANYGLL